MSNKRCLIENKNTASKENGNTSNENKTWKDDEPLKKKQKLNTNEIGVSKLVLSRGNLNEIEQLYKKYFSKSVQDTIVIIANILDIISISNQHLIARIDKSSKKKFESEKLKERCEAYRIHGRYQNILEAKLKKNIIDVISSFAELEFDSAFKMLFLGILSVIRVLGQPQFRKGYMKNVLHLLWKSLKNSENNYLKFFSIFRSKKFRHDCINLKILIEYSRHFDPKITDRMTLFFISRVNSREYFQAVIEAVTSDSIKDLELLIEDATFQCCNNSEFEDLVDSSTVKHLNSIIPVTENIQSPINYGKTIQHSFLAKNPDETYQQIPVVNYNESQTIGNTTVQPLTRYFYESFSSSLQDNISVSFPEVISTKNSVDLPTFSKSPLLQITSSGSEAVTSMPTTSVTFKPSIRNNKYRCYADNCNSSATVICSICKKAKYCSEKCQHRDWYDYHENACERLLNTRLASKLSNTFINNMNG